LSSFLADTPFNSKLTTPSRAAAVDRAGTVRALLAAGADVNARDGRGQTALMKGAAAGNTDAVQLLLKAGAEVNARDNEGKTALIQAADQTSYTEVGGKRQYTAPAAIEALLAAGADPRLTDNDDETALIKAEECGEVKLITALRKAGSKGLREALKGVPEAELFYAVRTRNIPAVKRLLQRGARLAVKDKRGHSPLIYAAVGYFGENALLECVLQNSSDLSTALELRDPQGLSVLVPNSSEGIDEIKLGDAIHNPSLGNKVRDLLCLYADSERRKVLKNAGINADQKIEMR
jgi:ankyrin repeat protein